MIKTPREIRLLSKAAQISNSCIPLVARWLREDITERELAHRVRKHINSRGATLSFETLVGSGKRSGMIHTKPHVTGAKIAGIGYIDFGASYHGYKSDVTIPFIKGRVGEKERKLVKTVLDAYKFGVKSVKVGEPCWVVHWKVNRFLQSRGYKMQHSLGHGLGLKIHERPKIVAPRKRLHEKKKKRWERIKRVTFQNGMVFTIEPGVYTKRFGCRIENDFLLKNGKLRRLTNSRLIIIS